MREITNQMWDAIWTDVMPQNMACLIDFGLDPMSTSDPTQPFGALQWAVKHGGVTKAELDRALGDGPALTALVDRPENPYRCVITTPWDDFPEEDA